MDHDPTEIPLVPDPPSSTAGSIPGGPASPVTSRVKWFTGTAVVVATGLVVAGVVMAAVGDDISSVTLLAFGFVLMLVVLRPLTRQVFDQQADQIRSRVDAQAQTSNFVINASDQAVIRVDSLGSDAGTMRASASLEKQEAILREMYTQGLAQAKVSFLISIVFASAGAALLMFGVFLAIVNASTPDGQEYASIVSLCAGIVTNVISSIFFVQSNRARRDMAQQGTHLREESQEDRRLSAAREIAAGIGNDELRDTVRARLSMTLLSVDHDLVVKNHAAPEQV